MAFAVSRRRREIGLRMALGARGSDVRRTVVRRAGGLVLAGCAIGVLLAGIALLACLVPAHRAASVDPMTALRQE
jgi:putative ABC transport system permease protein